MNQASVIRHAYRLISCSLILVAIPFCICPASVQYNKKKLTQFSESYTFIQKLSVWIHIIEGLNMTIRHVFKYGICDLSGINAKKEVIKTWIRWVLKHLDWHHISRVCSGFLTLVLTFYWLLWGHCRVMHLKEAKWNLKWWNFSHPMMGCKKVPDEVYIAITTSVSLCYQKPGWGNMLWALMGPITSPAKERWQFLMVKIRMSRGREETLESQPNVFWVHLSTAQSVFQRAADR